MKIVRDLDNVLVFNVKLGVIVFGVDVNDFFFGIGFISVLGIIYFFWIFYCCSDFREEIFSLYGE